MPKKQIAFSIEEKYYDALLEAADPNLSAYIRQIITEYLEDAPSDSVDACGTGTFG